MILREATIQYKGYDPDELSDKSQKYVCTACDKCGRIKYVRFNVANKWLCKSCVETGKKHKPRTDEQKKNYSKSKMGDKNPQFGMTGELSINFGKHKTLECKIIRSCQEQGINIDEFNGFIGRHPKNRSYALVEEKCIKMNEKFKGSHFHHITRSLGIYIPGKLHNHIRHNMRTGLNMGEINMLALQFINGGL